MITATEARKIPIDVDAMIEQIECSIRSSARQGRKYVILDEEQLDAAQIMAEKGGFKIVSDEGCFARLTW